MRRAERTRLFRVLRGVEFTVSEVALALESSVDLTPDATRGIASRLERAERELASARTSIAVAQVLG